MSQEIGDLGRRERWRRIADTEAEQRAAAENMVSLLVFRAGSPEPKAVPLSLVTRLEEIDCRKIELSNGRHMVQYRGQLMPLVRISDEVKHQARGRAAAAGVLRRPAAPWASWSTRSWTSSRTSSTSRSAAIAPACWFGGDARPRHRNHRRRRISCRSPIADWFRRKDCAQRPCASASCCWSTTPAFFRNMLSPVLKAAGYEVTAVSSAQEALALLKKGQRFDALVTDIDMPDMDGFALAEAVRGELRSAKSR